MQAARAVEMHVRMWGRGSGDEAGERGPFSIYWPPSATGSEGNVRIRRLDEDMDKISWRIYVSAHERGRHETCIRAAEVRELAVSLLVSTPAGCFHAGTKT